MTQISFQQFHFCYKAQKQPTLKNINLNIHQGEKVLILGPSGSGKSTLGYCVNGLIPFSFEGKIQGSLTVEGIETQKANIFTLSNHVGTVQQDTDAQFIGLSVGEDIAFALENDAVPRPQMLKSVESAATTVGMQAFLEENPFNLSGGQKQKVALAGVLHNHTKILLFDEPLAALDPKMGSTAIELIDQIHKHHNKTILIIEHRLEDVLHAPVDRIIVMHDGEIACDMTPDELLKSALLQSLGIREPLYIKALKFAGVDLSTLKNLSQLRELTGFEDKVKAHFAQTYVEKEEPYALGETLIDVQHVSFAYEHMKALRDVSFKVRRGEKIAVVGKNGAGKSTMAKLLCGILRPNEGNIFFESTNIASLSLKEIGQRVGYVMQNPNQMLVKDIILDEIKLGLQLHNFNENDIQSRAERVLKMCDLYGMRHWPISVLSYGQRKRVTIAAMLALCPQVLIVDEPTAGQDLKHYTEIMDFLDELNRVYGITILFITHDMHLAIEYTHRALVFAEGELIADDHVFKVLSNTEVIEKANLKETSLAILAKKCGLDPEQFIHAFIAQEKGEKYA